MTGIWLVVVGGLAVVLWRMARQLGHERDRLRRTEARLASVLEGTSGALAVWARDGTLLGCNAEFRAFYPDAPVKAGVVYEDLLRYTANRGLIRLVADDDAAIEAWVQAHVAGFGAAHHHDVWRTASGRWVDVDTRPTDEGEILTLYCDTTALREDALTRSGGEAPSERAEAAPEQWLVAVDRVRAASSPEAALEAALEAACDWGDFTVAHAYRVPADSGSLEPLPVWHTREPGLAQHEALRTLVEASHPMRGEGLAGRAWHAGRIVWVPNVSVDPSIDEGQRGVMHGLRGGCALPVTFEGRPRVVLVFYAARPLTPDPLVERMLMAVGAILGWALWAQRDVGSGSEQNPLGIESVRHGESNGS